MITFDTILKVCELIGEIITPFLVALIGWIISKKIEDIKIFNLKRNDWNTAWAQEFLKSFHDYRTIVSDTISALERLSFKVYCNEANDAEANEIAHKINESLWAIFKRGRRITTFLVLVENDPDAEKVKRLLDEIRTKFIELTAKKKGHVDDLYMPLLELTKLIKKIHGKIIGLTN